MPYGGSFGQSYAGKGRQSYSGLQFQPWQIGPLNDAAFNFLNADFGNAAQAMATPYAQKLPWTNFATWLQGQGAREMENMFNMENARRIAAGGDLNSQLMPVDFLSSFDPVKLFKSRSARDRGETGGSPFTMYRSR